MDSRDSSNNFFHRRYNNGRVYVTDERHAETNDDNDHERFNMNQYYNAVEDEQIYMDEYTSLLHRYNEFIVNSNTLLSRMEQTLRENIGRAVARQTYYYHESDYLYRRELRRALHYRSYAHPQPHVPIQTPTYASGRVAPAAPAAPAAPDPPNQNQSPVQRFGDVLPRLVSRYIASENAREQRIRNNNNNNLFSMLYTFPIEALVGGGGVGGLGGAARQRTDDAPTNDQINRATLNTVFSHILSPVNATCPISRDEFNDESEITMIRGCNHLFNRASLREWFVSHSTCPMCRRDIREYRPPSLEEPSAHRSDIPRNISIDSADRDHVTFSYDLPSNLNNEDMYRNLINTVANMISNNQSTQNNSEDRNGDNDDDIMEVD
jgi:hypothetical protein